jgi:hypothetical protein
MARFPLLAGAAGALAACISPTGAAGAALAGSAGAPAPAPSASSSCAADIDCFLNGACTAGACVCDSPWSGPACTTLVEGPSVQVWPNPAAPIPPTSAKIADSWGVTIAQDPAGGAFHAYVCTACAYNGSTPLPFSMHGSIVIHATAAALAGPYHFVDLLAGTFSEGPHLVAIPPAARKAGDPAWALHTVGVTTNGTAPGQSVCTGDYGGAMGGGRGRRLRPRRAAAAPSPITPGDNRFVAPSPGGPWTPLPYNISHLHGYAYRSNPSAAFDAAGSAWLAFRTQPAAGAGAAAGETLAVARAPSWDAPLFTSLAEPLIAGLVGQEDPFLWRSARGWHMLSHAMGAPGGGVGGLFASLDGVAWVQAPHPAYTTTVNMTGPGWGGAGGAAVTFSRRERPELLLDAATGAPTHLLTGAMAAGTNSLQRSYSIMTALG